MLKISDDLMQQIFAEAEKAYPNECCGFLIGTLTETERCLVTVLPTPNASETEEQYHRFVITPEQMLYAEQYARRQTLAIIGFYHSHPDCPAIPSEYDRAHALPVYSYLIVSAVRGKATDVRSYQLDPVEDYQVFIEERINGRS